MSDTPWIDLFSCRSRLIWANERDVEQRYIKGQSMTQDYTACLLLKRGRIRFGHTVDVGPAQWLFWRVGNDVFEFSGNPHVISLRFELMQHNGEPLFRRERSLVLEAERYPELEATAQSLVRLLRPWGEGGCLKRAPRRVPVDVNFRMEAAFHNWLAAYVEAMRKMGDPMQSRIDCDPRVLQVTAWLRERPMTEKFSQTELARRCGLGSNQLALLFKRDTGVSPFAYYDRLRLTHAEQALNYGEKPIKEIAYDLGFSTPSHFTNWCRKHTGKSPTEIRSERHAVI